MRFKAWARWILRLAGTRIVVLLFALVVAVICRDIALSFVKGALGLSDAPTVWLGPRGPVPASMSAVSYSVVACTMMLVLGYCVYRALIAVLEQRSAVELEASSAAKEFAAGALIGVGFMFLIVGIIWGTGSLRVIGAGSILAAVSGASHALTAGFMEELVIRGVVFRIVEKRWGTWITLFLTAGIFGLLHLGNENSSWLCAISIALSAGIVLGLAFVLTRRLWLAIGLHFGANFCQAMIGLPVSGGETSGLVVSELSGPPLLTGGEFGIEASAVTVVLAMILSIVFVKLVRDRNQIRQPFWRHVGEA